MPSCLWKAQGKTLPLSQRNEVTPGAILQSGSRVGSGAHNVETSSVVPSSPRPPHGGDFHRRIGSGATKKLTPLFSEQHSSEATVLWRRTTCWGRRNGSCPGGVRLPWVPVSSPLHRGLVGQCERTQGFPPQNGKPVMMDQGTREPSHMGMTRTRP